MIRINLLPVREAQRRERVRQHLSVLILSMVAVLVIGVAVYMQFSIRADHQFARNKQLQAEIATLQAKIGKVNEIKALKEGLEKKLGVLAELKRNKEGPVRMMDSFAKALPAKAWLESIRQVGQAVEIKGSGLDENEVASFMRNLQQSDSFSGVELRVTQQANSGSYKVQQFTLSATVSSVEQKPSSAKLEK